MHHNKQLTPSRARIIGTYLYDLIALVAIWFFASAVALVLTQGETIEAGSTWFQVYLLLWAYAYYLYSWCRTGQTLGMRAWKLQLQDIRGQRITPLAATGMFIASLFSLICLGLGHLWRLFHPQRRSWHDFICHTRITLQE